MVLVGLDTETHLITPTDYRPPMVSCALDDGSSVGLWSATCDRTLLQERLRNLLMGDATVVGHNLAFDMEVIRRWCPDLTRLIFDKYERGQVWCTRTAEQLLAIVEGVRAERSFSLDELTKTYGVTNKDADPEKWRLRYSELDGKPVKEWTEAARRYAKVDATAALELARRQQHVASTTAEAFWVFDGKPHRQQWVRLNKREAQRQFRYAYALNIMRCEGIGVDPERVRGLSVEVADEIADIRGRLIDSGLVRDNPKNKAGLSRNLKLIRERVAAAFDGCPPMTEAGNIETNRATLLHTNDPALRLLAEFSKPEKKLAFLKTLESAVEQGGRFCPSWNVLVNTGRTSCGTKDNPGNLQNQPREGGIRECFVPGGKGNVLCANDYATAELRSLAQVQLQWFGKSSMAEVLQRGADLHQELADGVDWLDRQGAKAINFGAPGGLGAATLADYAKSAYRVQLSDEQAQDALQLFLDRWPEMRRYFGCVAEMTRQFPTRIKQQWSGRLRGGLGYTNTANTYFQGLTADGAKAALWSITKACFVGRLEGCRPVLFEHDEVIVEGPEDGAHEWAAEMDGLMVEGMAQVTPDIPVVTEPALMRRWYKGAKTVTDAKGRLTTWEPQS